MDPNQLSQFLVQSMINAQTVKWGMILLLGVPTLITGLKMWLPYHWLWLGNWSKLIPPGLCVITICLVIKPFTLVNCLIGFSTGVGSMGLHEFVAIFRGIPAVNTFFAKFEPKMDANGQPIKKVFVRKSKAAATTASTTPTQPPPTTPPAAS